MTNAIKVLLQMQSGFLQLESTLLILVFFISNNGKIRVMLVHGENTTSRMLHVDWYPCDQFLSALRK
jgi:hypothetical protein